MKNKTVWDAVNEFKGDLSNIPVIGMQGEAVVALCIRDIGEDKIGEMSGWTVGFNEVYYRHICTYKEFNALVAEMELGLDVNPVSYQSYNDYLIGNKELLEPESIVDWDGDGKGKQYALVHNNKGLVEFFYDKPIRDKHVTALSCWINNEGRNLHLRSHWELHERPTKQESNIYTQEMCDNGELPSVGMECIACYGSHKKEENKVIIAHVNKKGQFACIDSHGDYLIQYITEDSDESFKPITTATPLIDGEVYQFDYLGEGLLGRYVDGYFINGKTYLAANTCTNIKPLTLKGE